MSEREKEIMKVIAEGIPKLSEFEKGYLLGVIEGKVNGSEHELHKCATDSKS